MEVKKRWLEQKVQELNEWIQQNPKTHFEYGINVHKRNYYVNKLIELEESNLKVIKV